MKAIIKHNGEEIPEALCLVNTASNIVTLTTMWSPNTKLDLKVAYVEVNIFGKLKAVEGDIEDIED